VHVGDEKDPAIGCDANVLRHAVFREPQIAQHLAIDHIDLDQPAAAEFAGEDRIAPIDREIGVVDAGAARCGERLLQRHRVRVAEVEALSRFGDDDRRPPVGREI
jgi:hypothetical protein